MIERTQVNGRDALVSYMTAGREPATAETAELVKVTFEDTGEVAFMVPAEQSKAKR